MLGQECLRQLLSSDSYSRVVVVARKAAAANHAKLAEVIVDFDRLEQHSANIGADHVFCCLGTTIRHAGSEEAFRRIDHDYPLSIAGVALRNGATKYMLVSSIGAAPQSRFWYLRVKGQLEQDLAGLGYHAVHCLRPSWLDGDRAHKRVREEFGIGFTRAISFLLVGPWRKYRVIKAADVARAMIVLAQSDLSGFHTHESDRLVEIARTGQP